MKKQFLIFLILLLFISSISAQTKEARKFDEFGNTNCDEYLARMDYLLVEVNESPSSKGYVFVYSGKLQQFIYDKNDKNRGTRYVFPEVGAAQELIGYLKRHLRFRRFPAEKIVFVEAGFREKFTIEFWIVPDEANVPKPTPTLKKIKQRRQTRKPNGFCGDM